MDARSLGRGHCLCPPETHGHIPDPTHPAVPDLIKGQGPTQDQEACLDPEAVLGHYPDQDLGPIPGLVLDPGQEQDLATDLGLCHPPERRLHLNLPEGRS